MTIAAVVALLIQYLPTILAAAGVVTPAMQSLIQQLGAAVPGIITALTSGASPTDETLALLAGFQQEIAALKTNTTTLDADTLQMADTLTAAIDDALQASKGADQVCDPATLTPLATF